MTRLRSLALAAGALAAAGLPLAVPAGPAAAQNGGAAEDDAARPEIPNTSTELVTVEHHPDERIVEVVLGPVELTDGMPHLRTRVQMVRMPVEGWLRGYRWRITDGEGNRLPDPLLHHVNFVDPDHRQLFDPTPRRVLAAGRETREALLPPVVGIPFEEGSRYMVSAMFANATGRDYAEAYLRVELHYVAEGDRLIRPHDVFPFYLDVMGPVGLKDFAVPPGRTVQAWEGSPAIDARILGVGGHLHDHAERLRLIDLTTGEVIWDVEPNASESGRVYSVPMGAFWWHGGVPIRADHRYRAEVVYQNPGTEPSPLGGMGVIAGVVLPADGAEWPELDRSDPDYREDLMNHVMAPEELSGHHHGAHGDAGDGSGAADDGAHGHR